MDFVPFPKISRLSREVIVTEKIDGTNACIAFDEGGAMFVGSRSRWIGFHDDNFGFAKWAFDNRHDLAKLGPGRHFGEWWGSGIQRGYGLPKGEKRFSLFNVSRWADDAIRPSCCHVVPTIGRYAAFELLDVRNSMLTLMKGGSFAAPGFMKPEGIVIFHAQGNIAFKKTFEKDDAGKGHESVVSELTP